MHMGKTHRCGCIVQDSRDGKVLVVFQKSSGMWGFPKGSMKFVESFWQCAIRELREETGIESWQLTNYTRQVTHDRHHFFCFVERTKPPIQIQDSEEIGELRWVSMYELQSLKKSRVTERLLSSLSLPSSGLLLAIAP